MPPRTPHPYIPPTRPWLPQPNGAPQGNGPHAVRMQFEFRDTQVQVGATTPLASQPMRVDGLIQKTIQVAPGAASMGFGLLVQGTITDIGNAPNNPTSSWFTLGAAIMVGGVFPIVTLGLAGTNAVEPSLNAIRVVQVVPQQGGAVNLRDLIVTFSGLWTGPGLWMTRHTPYAQ